MTTPRAEPTGGAGDEDFALLRQAFREQLDRWHHFVRLPAGEPDVLPATDVIEAAGRLVVVVELPGVAEDGVEVVAADRRLQVTGTRRRTEPAGALCFRGRPQGRFRLDVALPVPIDPDAVSACCQDGLLTVVLPLRRHSSARRVPVRTDRREQVQPGRARGQEDRPAAG